MSVGGRGGRADGGDAGGATATPATPAGQPNSPFLGEWPAQLPRQGRTPAQFDPNVRRDLPADGRDYGHDRAAARNRKRRPRSQPMPIPILKSLPVAPPPPGISRNQAAPSPKKADIEWAPRKPKNEPPTGPSNRQPSIRIRPSGPTPAPPGSPNSQNAIGKQHNGSSSSSTGGRALPLLISTPVVTELRSSTPLPKTASPPPVVTTPTKNVSTLPNTTLPLPITTATNNTPKKSYTPPGTGLPLLMTASPGVAPRRGSASHSPVAPPLPAEAVNVAQKRASPSPPPLPLLMTTPVAARQKRKTPAAKKNTQPPPGLPLLMTAPVAVAQKKTASPSAALPLLMNNDSPKATHSPAPCLQQQQTPVQQQNCRRSPAGPSAMPLLKDDRWKTLPEVTVHIGPNLHAATTIPHMFRTVESFGIVEMIDILVDTSGLRTGNARIRFSKIFAPFWESGEIDFGHGPTPIRMMKPLGTFTVQSRVNPSRLFPEKISFSVKSLEFGFMIKPEEFITMYSTKPDSPITWEINLRRKRVYISFNIRFDKDDAARAKIAESAADNREDKFMIEIPFTQFNELLVPAEEDENGGVRTFVIPLVDPPKVFRILKNWTKSMEEPDLTRWTIHDAWMRQTDIEYKMLAKDERPVGLRTKVPVIDIGKWTTYRLTFELNPEQQSRFRMMMDALRDFNVPKKPLEEFHVNYDTSGLVQVWNYLGDDVSDTTSTSELLDWSKPHLTFSVRYQLEVCVSHGYLNEHNISEEFIDKITRIAERDAISLLEHVAELKQRFFNPMDIFHLSRTKKVDSSRSIPEFCVHMRRATITPTGILFNTPSVEISNRVIRNYDIYSDRFIRVSFTDEKSCGRIRFTDKITSHELFTRVFRTLKHGIMIGDRHYEFLAFGNSQLREHGAYFFASTTGVTAASIREWMGHFDNIRVIAKYASRLGQCFSTTKQFTYKFTCSKIPDIERNGYCFTDGVGKMSPLVSVLISMQFIAPHRKVSETYRASCFQIRLGGHKGVLVIDPNIVNCEIQLRDSQSKFWSEYKMLEIIRSSQFASASLNRQLIQVMSSLGVPDDFFLNRLRTILSEYSIAIKDPSKALELLTRNIDPNQSTLQMANLVREGFMDSKEPFIMSLMYLWRAWTIKYLKEKAKITITDGAFLLGVVDETATLRGWYEDDKEDDLPQIFCQITDTQTGEPRVITGRCIVARNPSLHPGDVRIVEAVDAQCLHHLIDVVVFPQTGDRDVPSMLSGGDLDGDDYVVIWDKELTAPGVMINDPPALYRPDKPTELTRNVTIEDVKLFFVNYMKNDRLGAIANAHLAWADRMSDGVKSSICRELAQLHSDAVDYPKTGIRAQMRKKFRVTKWPHFFEKPEEEGVYHSDKILGRLYDMVEKVDFTPAYDFPPNEKIMTAFNLTEEELDAASELKAEYDEALKRIMNQHEIKTEFEVYSTFVMSHSGSNDYKFHEEIGEISLSLRERFRKEISQSCPNKKTDLPRKVAAMYVVTQQAIARAKEEFQNQRDRRTPKSKGMPHILSKEEVEKMPLMSFPWVFPEVLVDILRGRNSIIKKNLGVNWVTVESIEMGTGDVEVMESAGDVEAEVVGIDGDNYGYQDSDDDEFENVSATELEDGGR